jgi:nicotinamidase/pyrazinamidase
VLDALKHGFKVKAVENAMRAVDLQPGDGDRALDEMRDAGAEIVEAREARDSAAAREAGYPLRL